MTEVKSRDLKEYTSYVVIFKRILLMLSVRSCRGVPNKQYRATGSTASFLSHGSVWQL